MEFEHSWKATRLSLPFGTDLDEAAARFEAAVPPVPMKETLEILRAGGTWADVVALQKTSAPNGFMMYARNDARQLFDSADDSTAAIAYLMGNHTIAERMHRFEPRVMNHAPLHVVLTQQDGAVRFTVDLPSAQFGSFGIPEVTAVGLELDQKLAHLLDELGLQRPQSLSDL